MNYFRDSWADKKTWPVLKLATRWQYGCYGNSCQDVTACLGDRRDCVHEWGYVTGEKDYVRAKEENFMIYETACDMQEKLYYYLPLNVGDYTDYNTTIIGGVFLSRSL